MPTKSTSSASASTSAKVAASASGLASKPAQRVIKKYPNRRLYDTVTSAYITLADVKQLVVKSEEFRVVDAKTNEDLTRAILLQIILEEEAGGSPLFSEAVLAQMIRVYGNAMQGMMGTVLEKNVQAMADMQNNFAEQARQFNGGNPLSAALGPLSSLTNSLNPLSNLGNMAGAGKFGDMNAAFAPEAWSKLMQGQNPMMQGLMNSYVEHSKTLFAQMQEQMHQQVQQQMKSMMNAGKPSTKR